MDLKLTDVARLLNLNTSAIHRYIRRKSIPAYRINHQYRFNRAEIVEWALNNRIPMNTALTALTVGTIPVDIAELTRRGGVYHHVAGTTPRDVINAAVGMMTLPAGIDKEMIASQLIEREEIQPTAIGNGIALPHPKSPVMTDAASERIAFFMLSAPVDFRAADRVPVHVLCVILSANQNRHLEMLSKTAHLCLDSTFAGLLKRASSPATILEYIETASKKWKAA
ncbi:MAG: PTS sugar transporter subunit IIA [Spirochaetota bacterium]